MPQVQVVNQLNREEGVNPAQENLQTFFSKMGKDYRDKEDRVEIGNLINQYKQNREDANAWENLQLGLEQSNISPTKRLQTQQSLNEMKKVITEQDKALNAQVKNAADEAKKLKTEQDDAAEKQKKAQAEVDKKAATTKENELILVEGGKTPEEAARLAPIVSTATARSLVKPTKGAKEKFEEGLAVGASKEVPELEKTIAKGADTLTNIDRIEDLASKNLKGGKGYVKALFNTEAAAEAETLGATNLDTVIKLFNPAGTLPTAKLNWLKNTFAINPWDNLSTIKGKLNTQRTITKQGLERAKIRSQLLKKYYGNIPEDVSKEFDAETGRILDSLQETLEPKKASKQEAPEGKVRVKDKKTGKTGSVTPYPGMESKYDVLSK